ncbi:interleukin-23 receptor [Octodon degus]|uniref:Interleukin-23 receptor n=1 Tax=Octodon degus TaxID=10160 RepID=A0A6P3F847_OCTDE|nr:interleukin-23 receptor [Octodon degus]
MNQVTIQLEALITLYILFYWCHAGITSIKCSGNLWVEPATVFKMGMNISVYCQVAGMKCQPRHLYLYKNDLKERFHMSKMNRTTARHWFRNFLEPRASVYCTAQCPGRSQETLVCGQDISSGLSGSSVSHGGDKQAGPHSDVGVQQGQSAVLLPKSLSTLLTMHDSWGPKHCHIGGAEGLVLLFLLSLETGEERWYPTSSYLKISTEELPAGREFLVQVQAANALGTEESRPLRVRLDDIVIPSESVISRAETLGATTPKTIVYWGSNTVLEKVSCEMRFAAAANHTWTVTELNTSFIHAQWAEFFLEPDTNYTFQVRCREAGKRHWQPWSAPFYHRTPDTVPQVTQDSQQRGAQDLDSGPLVAPVLKGHLASDRRQDVGLLSGMVFFAVTLSVLSLIGIFSRSLRTRIKRKLLLLIPAWLHEEIPNVENSNVVKMLQEKDEFVSNNPGEQVLYVDPVIAEIREVVLPEEYKPAHHRKEASAGGQAAQAAALPSSAVVYVPALSSGYKPQISGPLPGGDHLSSGEETNPSPLRATVGSLDLAKNARGGQHPQFAFPVSSMDSLSGTLILEELSLILNQGECGPPDILNTTEGESTLLLGSDAVPEQTVLPDEFVSCLGIVNEELPSANPYFPQNILESCFSRISLPQK